MEHVKGELTFTFGQDRGWWVKIWRNGIELIASVRGATFQEARANAAELVRRWNAYKGLLEACELFLAKWKAAGPQGSHQFEKFDVVVSAAKAAIAAAKGE